MGYTKGKEDKNQAFTTAGREAGFKLQQMFDAGATEAAITKAGFGQDSGGRWFAKVGARDVRLDTDCSAGKAGDVVNVPEVVAVPIPLQLRIGSLPTRHGIPEGSAL